MKITDALVAEHAICLGVFDAIERALPSLATPVELRTMASIVEAVLRPHAAAENELVYVALDHALAQRGELDRMHHEHQEIDERLRKVHATGDCAEARRLLKAALTASREHFRVEEREVFPLIEQSFNPDTLRELGRSWLAQRVGSSTVAA